MNMNYTKETTSESNFKKVIKNNWTFLEYESDNPMLHAFNTEPLTKEFTGWHSGLWHIIKDHYLRDQGGIAIDCGASYGWFTIPFSKHMDHVYSFEMRQDVYSCLEDNLKYVDSNNVTIFNKGVYSTSTYMTYDSTYTSTGTTSVQMSADTTVEMIALDDLNLTEPVRFIKIDVEGAEYEVLTGAKNLLITHKPLLMFEMHTHRSLDNYIKRQQVFKFLKEIGYDFEDQVLSDYIFRVAK